MSLYTNLTPIIQDANGRPIVGAYTHFYESGTTTYKTIYSDSNLSVPQANPVRSLAGGVLPVIHLDGTYKVTQNDASDASLYPSLDPVGFVTAWQFELWVNDNPYSFGDIVRGSDGYYYKSITAGTATNQGNDPTLTPASWESANFLTVTQVPSQVSTIAITNAAAGQPARISSTGEAAGSNLVIESTGANSGISMLTTGYGDLQLTSAGGILALTGYVVKINGKVQHGFRGALVNTVGLGVSVPTGVWTAVPLDTTQYDTDSIHDDVVNNTRLTVPAGVSFVKIKAATEWVLTTVGTKREAKITKNGISFVGQPEVGVGADKNIAIAAWLHPSTPIISVVPGDYFELEVRQDSGVTIAIIDPWVSIELIE